MTQARPAVFLDRDGVLNEIVERDGEPASPRTFPDFRLVPDVEAVRRLSAAGFLVFVVTNQPDIRRGHITTALVERTMAAIRARIHVDDWRVCPHEDADNCECRKPKSGMLLDLARHWHLDLRRSWMIGDMWRDMDAGHAAGCCTVLIRRDYNRGAMGDFEVNTLAEAVERVLEQSGGAS